MRALACDARYANTAHGLITASLAHVPCIEVQRHPRHRFERHERRRAYATLIECRAEGVVVTGCEREPIRLFLLHMLACYDIAWSRRRLRTGRAGQAIDGDGARRGRNGRHQLPETEARLDEARDDARRFRDRAVGPSR